MQPCIDDGLVRWSHIDMAKSLPDRVWQIICRCLVPKPQDAEQEPHSPAFQIGARSRVFHRLTTIGPRFLSGPEILDGFLGASVGHWDT